MCKEASLLREENCDTPLHSIMEAQSNVCAQQAEIQRRHRANMQQRERTTKIEKSTTDSARQREREGTLQRVRQSRANVNSKEETGQNLNDFKIIVPKPL